MEGGFNRPRHCFLIVVLLVSAAPLCLPQGALKEIAGISRYLFPPISKTITGRRNRLIETSRSSRACGRVHAQFRQKFFILPGGVHSEASAAVLGFETVVVRNRMKDVVSAIGRGESALSSIVAKKYRGKEKARLAPVVPASDGSNKDSDFRLLISDFSTPASPVVCPQSRLQ